MPNHFALTFFFAAKGVMYHVVIQRSNRDLFTCEDNMFSRKSSPGISLVFI